MKIQSTLTDIQTVAAAQPVNATAVNLLDGNSTYCKGYSVELSVTVTTPSAGAFTAAITDICTKSAHGMLTGLKVRVSTSSALPGGLSAGVDYFVIKLSSSTFSLAASLSDAIAGTAIDITDTGTGTQTITPTAIAGASYTLYGSPDGVNYASLGVSNNITTSAEFIHEKIDPQFDYLQIRYTLTAGQISSTQTLRVKGY